MRRTKRLIAIAMIMVLAVSLCFAGGSSEGASAKGSGGKTTISMTWWGDTKRNEVYNAVIDEFEKANPGVAVERPFGTWANFFDKLSTQIAGGVAPDVIGMHQRYVSEYAARNALLDLQPYVDSGVLDLSDVPASVVEAGKVNGKLYMIPQGITGSGIGYYTTTFDDLGVAYPNPNWTWDEYVACLTALKKAADATGKRNFWPSADLSNDFYNFSYWVRAKGENLFTEDGELGFTKATMIEWFDLWTKLRKEGMIVDAATSVEYVGIPLEQSLMATGQVAIAGMPASQLWLYQALVTDGGTYNIVRFPNFADGPAPEYVSGAFYTVNARSAHPEDAVHLISFFINNPTAQQIFKQEQGLPPANKAVEFLASSATDAERRSIEFIQDSLVPNASPEPYPPTGYNEINSNYVNFANAVAFGEMTSAQATDSFFKISESILN